ncbi:hypothetical protein LCGC14_0734230 [marine sediment metagenome]|uniref:Uncharacterized protein n=1 Tax=marine sediment metagenome TaxID=412755 RepID=A0A0F9STV9_9ZZZZ
MANEITVSALLRYSKTRSINLPTGETTFDMSGDQHADNVQAVPINTAVALEMGPISANVGWMLLQNEDSTNYIEVQRATGESAFLKIKAGEFALFRLAATAPFVVANTGICNLRITVLED